MGGSRTGGRRSVAVWMFWPLFVATLGVVAAFRFWTTPGFESFGVAGPIDATVGYDMAAFEAYWTELASEGRSFYLSAFHRLDMAFPAVYGAMLLCGFAALLPHRLGVARWPIAAVLALPAPVLDYTENAMLAGLMRAQALDPATVERASLFTQAKYVLFAASVVGLLVWAAGVGVVRLVVGRSR